MMKVRNTFIIFIVSGFWHGANWTFIVWGALNAIYFLPILLTNRNRKNIDTVASGRLFPSPNEFLSMGATFGLTVIAWVFFRAENMGHAMAYISEIFSSSTFNIPEIRPRNTTLLIIGFLVIEWYGRGQQFAIQNLGIQWKRPFRYALYYAIIILIFWFGGKEQEFIYFQF